MSAYFSFYFILYQFLLVIFFCHYHAIIWYAIVGICLIRIFVFFVVFIFFFCSVSLLGILNLLNTSPSIYPQVKIYHIIIIGCQLCIIMLWHTTVNRWSLVKFTMSIRSISVLCYFSYTYIVTKWEFSSKTDVFMAVVTFILNFFFTLL